MLTALDTTRLPFLKYSLWLITILSAKVGSTNPLKLAHGISKYSFLCSTPLSQSNHIHNKLFVSKQNIKYFSNKLSLYMKHDKILVLSQILGVFEKCSKLIFLVHPMYRFFKVNPVPGTVIHYKWTPLPTELKS